MFSDQLQVPVANLSLPANITIPKDSRTGVIFAHGSGSSRLSPRNRYVAETLHQHHIATLLFDLLTEDEEELEKLTLHLRFDIKLLTERLISTTQWINDYPRTKNFSWGYFGSSTGAAAALRASITNPAIKALVSRGGRTDLAGDDLVNITVPTLFIVGELDTEVLGLNQQSIETIPSETEKKLLIIAEANHLFEETGALEQVADATASWFKTYL
jgi:putative phosphoribosyl transferase